MHQKHRTILGINFGHGDSSAALIRGQTLIAAVEEERLTRVKHTADFPRRSIAWCLRQGKLLPSEIDVIAIARDSRNALLKRILFSIQHPKCFLSKKPTRANIDLNGELERLGLGHCEIFRIEHHLAHLMSTTVLTPDRDFAALSIDGLGDFVSAMAAIQNKDSFHVLGREYFPNSLGFFYTAMTQFLGFPYFGDEFKVMGLSSYGKPRFLEQMRTLIKPKFPFGYEINQSYFPLLQLMSAFSVENHQPSVSRMYNKEKLSELLKMTPRFRTDPIRSQHEDLARSVQVRFEEIANELVRFVLNSTRAKGLALAGGCAHNSVWVGSLKKNFGIENIYVAPASHDAGIAVGAAVAAAQSAISCESLHPGTLGPTGESDVDLACVNSQLNDFNFDSDTQLCEWLAGQISEGAIVGLVKGPLEFGPRALGNRSILADPRKKEMKEILNSRVKHRESFRPFAASVLHEHQEGWFENSFYAPTMEAVFKVNAEKAASIPAVTHVDGTCRIQSVVREYQPFYWELIESFRRRTGIPMLINTSFNDSEPIVCSYQDAVRCLSKTQIDILVLGNRVLSRKTFLQPQISSQNSANPSLS